MTDTAQGTAGGGAQFDDNLRGIVMLCAGVFIFSFQDVIIKLLSDRFPVHEIVFIRGFLALPLLMLIVHFDSGLGTLKTRKPWLHLLRALAMFASYMFFYLAVATMPLTDAVSLFFIAPLLITALSIVILGERVGWRRWLGVIVGFIGVLVILRPGVGAFQPTALLALGGALFYALAQLMARRLGATDSASVMAFYAGLTYSYMGALMGFVLVHWGPGEGDGPASDFLFRPWVMPGPLELAMLVTIAVISAIGFYLLSQAYRIGQANTVAPFEYTSMIWAMLLSFILLGSVPDLYTILGAILVAGAGVYVLHREGIKRDKPLAAKGIYRGR